MRHNSPLRSVPSALLFAACLTAGALILVGLRPLVGELYWWHVAVGDFTTAWERIPDQQLFLFTAPADQPWVYESWLGSVVFAHLDRLGGAGLSMLMRNLSVGLGVGLAGYVLARHVRRRNALVAGAAVTAVILGGFVGTEPYALAIPFVALAVTAVFSVASHSRTWWIAAALPLSVLVVVNLDFATAVALGFVGLVAGAETGRRIFTSGDERSFGIAALLFLAGIPSLFGFAYPPSYWPDAFAATFSVPTGLSPSAAIVSAVAVGAIAVVAAASADRLAMSRTALVTLIGGTALLAVFAPSTIAVFAVVAGLAVATALDGLTEARGMARVSMKPAIAVVLLFAVAAILLQPGVATRAPVMTTLYDDVRDTPPLAGSMPEDLPLDCAEELEATGRVLRIFHDPEHAGFLLHHLLDPQRPQAMIFEDHRGLLDAETARQADVLQSQRGARGLFREYGVNAAVVDRTVYSEVAAELDEAPGWLDLRDGENERFGCFIAVTAP